MAPALAASDVERLSGVAGLLRRAEQPVRVLRTIAWPADVEEEFFRTGAMRPPIVEYNAPDPTPVLEQVAVARVQLTAGTVIDDWLLRVCDAIQNGALMLAAVGTPQFYQYSKLLYGRPSDVLPDNKTTSLEIAERFDKILAEYIKAPPNFGRSGYTMTAEQLAAGITTSLQKHFGSEAPPVELVDHLASRALAGARYIRIRRDETFSDLDLIQLINHEALVHIATTLNGVAQARFPILAAGHPGTTRTQEGLAVIIELLSGSIDPIRFSRLSGRTLAIQMSEDGADFIDLYRYFLERHDDPHAAFDSARRVVRGGMMGGGAPFTKDCVYLHGLLAVHNFLRVAVRTGRFDCIPLLFCGKLDLEDVPALGVLAEQELLMPPRFLHPRVADPRFLIAYLGYSSFLNSVKVDAVMDHYAHLFERTPVSDLMLTTVPPRADIETS
jgi:uncharacterized protein (TIGR02421 family)